MIDVYDMTHANDPMILKSHGKITQTLCSRMGTGGNQVPVLHYYTIAGNTIGRTAGNGGNGNGFQEGISYTLNTVDRHAVAPCAEEVYEHHLMDSRVKGPINVMGTVSTEMSAGGNNMPLVRQVVGALCARDYKGVGNEYVQENKCQIQENTVRRLTPLECERLQGYPDGWTDIEFHGKPAPDTRRYKAIGNGMAQPCADFVIRRIAELS